MNDQLREPRRTYVTMPTQNTSTATIKKDTMDSIVCGHPEERPFPESGPNTGTRKQNIYADLILELKDGGGRLIPTKEINKLHAVFGSAGRLSDKEIYLISRKEVGMPGFSYVWRCNRDQYLAHKRGGFRVRKNFK